MIRLTPLEGIPRIRPGDDLAKALGEALARLTEPVLPGDVLVVCQKVVSRSEGRIVDLRDVTASPFAEAFASEHGKDPRVVEVVLRESRRIVRMAQGHLIVETSHGFVCANAGVDESNRFTPDTVILLPEDPDGSADRLREALRADRGFDVGVVVSDTFGRPWREGQIDVAIGCSGVRAVRDERGATDLDGRELHHTILAQADAVAAAAGLLMRKAAGRPSVLVSGIDDARGPGRAADLVRDPKTDVFR